jgi:hypothetical protein
MADALGIDVQRVGRALERLLEVELVALRPWRSGGRDGVWQLLPVEPRRNVRQNGNMHVADLLRSLGFDADGSRSSPGG